MFGPHPLLARRHFLTSTVLGTVGILIPMSAANAQPTTPPVPPPTETLTQKPATAPSATTTASTSFIAAAAEPSGDTSIRPFQYHATDEELGDLKRRVKSTRWPSGELVKDELKACGWRRCISSPTIGRTNMTGGRSRRG